MKTLARAAAMLLAFCVMSAAPAGAQLGNVIGGSDADMKAMLSAQGYDRIDIVDRGLSSTTFQACRGKDRMQFKFYWDGRIGTPQKIGGCRQLVTAADATRILQGMGYDRINLEEQQQGWVAIACGSGNRVRLEVTPFGDVGAEKILGACENDQAPSDIMSLLERQGYDRVEFTNRQPPRFVALACLNADRYELIINRFGEIADRRRVGDCEAPVSPYDLPQYLASKGYDRAKVIDARPPRYRVEACRGAEKVELVVGRYGRIVDEVRIGRCTPPLTLQELTAVLRQQGYANVAITDNGAEGYVAIACQKDRRFELIFTRYGEVLKERDLGRCSSLTVRDVLSGLTADGWRDIGVYAEGCRKGRRLRIRMNEFGEEIGREPVGRC